MAPADFLAPVMDVIVSPILILIAVALALSALTVLLGPTLRGKWGEAQAGRALERCFPAVRHDLILPDGRGGLTQIDHVALTASGLLVVETKHYRGAILGQAQEATWTQALGGQRHRFQNPLRQNVLHLKAVEALAPGIPVIGRVVFTGDAHFPKGLPEGVSRVSALGTDLAPLRGDSIPPAVEQAWRILLTQARTDRAARREHRRALRERFGADRRTQAAVIRLGIAVLLAVSGWWSWGPSVESTHPVALTRETTPHVRASRVNWSISAQPSPIQTESERAPSPRTIPITSSTDLAAPIRSPVPPPTTLPNGSIIWTKPPSGARATEACKLAMVAVLTENSAENRQRRAQACGLTESAVVGAQETR